MGRGVSAGHRRRTRGQHLQVGADSVAIVAARKSLQRQNAVVFLPRITPNAVVLNVFVHASGKWQNH